MDESSNNNNFNNNQNMNNGYYQSNNMNNNNTQNINNNFSGVNPNGYNNQVVNNQMMNNNSINNNFSNNAINNSQSIANDYNQNVSNIQNNNFNNSNNVYQNQMNNNYNHQPINNNISNEQNSNLMGAYTVPNNISNYPPQDNINNYNNDINNDELLKEFIGKNYDKITTRKFSFSGLFFSFGYMFYRKMFLYGFILSVIELIIVNFVPATISSIITLVIMVLCGLFVNKLYVGYAKKKIEKIKLENRNKDFNSLKTLCMMNGGTSIGKIFLGLLAEIGVALVIGIIVTIIGFKNTANNFLNDLFKGFNFTSNNSKNDNNKSNNNSNNDNNNSSSNNNSGTSIDTSDDYFDGFVMYGDIEDIFYVNVPSVFEDESYDNMVNYTYEDSNGVFSKCSFKIYSPYGYDDAKRLINGMANYDKAKTIYTDLINNTTWYSYTFNDFFGITSRYGTNVGDKVYIIDLEVQDDADSSCKTYLKNMMDSVRKK